MPSEGSVPPRKQADFLLRHCPEYRLDICLLSRLSKFRHSGVNLFQGGRQIKRGRALQHGLFNSMYSAQSTYRITPRFSIEDHHQGMGVVGIDIFTQSAVSALMLPANDWLTLLFAERDPVWLNAL